MKGTANCFLCEMEEFRSNAAAAESCERLWNAYERATVMTFCNEGYMDNWRSRFHGHLRRLNFDLDSGDVEELEAQFIAHYQCLHKSSSPSKTKKTLLRSSRVSFWGKGIENKI